MPSGEACRGSGRPGRWTGGAVAADRGLAGIEEREASRLAPRLVEDYETE
jgi:hypothetical protein